MRLFTDPINRGRSEAVSGGPDCSVGITTDYRLDRPGSNPGEDAIFRPSSTAPGVHSASCIIGTGSFPGVEAAGACC